MDQIQQAKATLRDAGYFVDNLWHVNDIKHRYECDNATAFEILDNALTNEGTMEQIWFAINFAIDEIKEEEEDEVREMLEIMKKIEDDEAQKVLEILKKEYLKSEVVSGEFIHSVILTLGFSEEIVRRGVQLFLDWDESPEKFDIEQGRLHWIIKPNNH